ncbi:hypothetical protein RF55_24934, partial [Lasius niger]
MKEIFRTDMDKLKEDICKLSTRINQLEDLLSSSNQADTIVPSEEEIIAELEERERRSKNLIFFKLDEPEEGSQGDGDLIKNILSIIQPEKRFQQVKTMRLGGKRQGYVRP